MNLLEDTNIKKYTSNNTIKIGCRYLKYVNGDKSMYDIIKEKKGITILIDSDVHKIIKNKQNEIFNKIDKTIPIQDVASEAIRKGINLIEVL